MGKGINEIEKRPEWFIKAGNIAFLLGILLELTVMMTDHMAVWTIPYRGHVTHLAFILFCIKILTNRYSKKAWVLIFGLGIIGALSYYYTRDEWLIRAVVMVIAAKDIDEEKIIKICFCGALAGTVVIMGLSLLGIAGRIADIRDYGRGGIEARYCLGFNHANNVHCMLWYLSALWLYIRRKKLTWADAAVILAADIGVYYLTASKTGLIATALLTIFAVILILSRKYIRVCKSIALYVLGAIGVILSLLLTIYGSTVSIYDSRVCALLNNALNQRLNMCRILAPISEWRLFTPPIELDRALDNGLASMVIGYGIVPLMLIVLSILYLVYIAYKKSDIMMLVVAVTFTFVWFMESTFCKNESLLCTLMLVMFFDNWYRGTRQTDI